MIDLNARHAAECERIKKAAAEKEQALLAELAAARQKLFLVILVALLCIAVIWNFKAGVKQTALSGPVGTGQTAVPIAVPATFVLQATVPEQGAAAQVLPGTTAAVKTGNGGNFSGGMSSGKK